MTSSRITAIIAVAVGIAGCAPSRAPFLPVTEPTLLVVVSGFSVTPPGGAGWLRLTRGAGATFMREIAPGHTVAAQALPLEHGGSPLDDAAFMKAVEERVDSKVMRERNRVLRRVFVPRTTLGLACIAYELDLLDTGAAQDGAELVLDIRGQICRKASGPGPGIDVLYSERGGPRGLTPEVRRQGEAFVDSLR